MSTPGFLFGEPPAPVPSAALPLAPPSRPCLPYTPQPGAFPHIRHADEVKTTHTFGDGVLRMTWTCRACGNIRGRL